MLKTILLFVREQDLTHAVVDMAMQWAREHDALLVALGVIDGAAVHPHEAVPLGAGQAKLELDAARLVQQTQSVERCLSNLAVRCAQKQVAFKPLEDVGRLAPEILHEAQRFDLIVIPRHAHYFHTATEDGLGKAIWEVIRAAPRPIIAVSDQVNRGDSIVIAYDGSLQATRALQAFEASGLAAGRPVHVVSLGEDSVVAARSGDRAVDFLDYHGIHATLHAETDKPNTAERIVDLAHRFNAGLLVLGAYGQARVCEFVLGSVTRSLLTHCTIPLFLYH